MSILVTGGTGKVGSALVDQLLNKGAQVRVLSRSKDAAAKLPRGVEVANGDMMDPAAFGAALKGVDRLFLLNASTPDELTQGLLAYDLARKAKLKHIVYLSVFEAHRFPDVPHFAAKVAIEAALKQFDIPFTIVRANYFMQNDVVLREPLTGAGVYPTPIGTRGVSAVDVRDIAEAAAITLTGSGHEGRTYNLVGPDVLTGESAAAMWSKALGKQVRYAGISLDAWQQQMQALMPAWLAYELRLMFQAYDERGFAASQGDLQTLTQLLQRAPRRYEVFARETAAQWQKA